MVQNTKGTERKRANQNLTDAIVRRCKKLPGNGLLQHFGHGAYFLSKEVEVHLHEEYDAEKAPISMVMVL